jgi:DNA-binding transcriptional MocR family regulator/CheY-like chemotaxis protein
VGSRPRARVLIVDDDDAVRLALRLVLDEHHDVLEAGDGGTALALVDRGRVDVVVLDLLLPKTDGFQVLQHLRTLPRRVPVVVLSALNTSWTAATAMRLGAVDYITKPFDDVQVLTAVAEGLDALRRDEAAGAAPRRAWRVLCVGVPIGVRATLSALLEGHGHVEAVPDVAAALARLDVTSPDAIVADVSEETLRIHPEPISRLRRQFPGELALLRRPGPVGALLRELVAGVAGHAHRWSRFSEVTRRTLDELAEHYRDGTVERLGQTMRVAPHALSARFRQEVGTPLRTYLQTLRIEIAKRLLIETSDSVAAVAARVGWHDASHLSRIFTAYVGCRPGVYRRRHRQPWSSVADRRVRVMEPFVTPIGERVPFDVAECAGELRPPPVFTAMMAEASREVERLGDAAVGTPIAAFSEAVGAYLVERGVTVSPGVVLTTSGTSASLAILARALASAGDIVAVEHPTRHVALAAFAAAGLSVLGIPVDDEGLRVDLLEAALREHRARFVYVQPTFQNPTGVSLSAGRRVELLALARSFDTLIVEDDLAAELAYEETPPPLRTEEGTERVVYLKSFSNLLVPALRVAVMVAPRACAEALQVAQHGLDAFPSALAQSVVARWVTTPELRRHLERVRRLLDARWQVMQGALETRMPEGVRWTLPRGGLSTWLDLPAPLTSPELLADVAKLGVGFGPGPLFCLDGSGQRGARLAFGATPPPVIERGVRHLARAIRERLRGPGGASFVDATPRRSPGPAAC